GYHHSVASGPRRDPPDTRFAKHGSRWQEVGRTVAPGGATESVVRSGFAVPGASRRGKCGLPPHFGILVRSTRLPVPRPPPVSGTAGTTGRSYIPRYYHSRAKEMSRSSRG